jgi:hypothetical protein
MIWESSLLLVLFAFSTDIERLEDKFGVERMVGSDPTGRADSAFHKKLRDCASLRVPPPTKLSDSLKLFVFVYASMWVRSEYDGGSTVMNSLRTRECCC